MQSRIPFTSLRFTRPRLPTLGGAVGLLTAILALGVSAWTLRITDRAGLSLAQTGALLAMNTRGAAAGRLAADRLAASAQTDASQMMAAQDLARRQAARNAYMPVYRPPTYARSSPDDEAGGGASTQPPYGGAQAYGQTPYGVSPYGHGGAQQAPALPPADSSAMGYTLPQATSH